MPTLHLIVGLPCAGKTTYSKQLERDQPALRLTLDDWHIRLFGHDFTLDFVHPEHDARHQVIEKMMWDVAARALQLGNDVILDFGFWAKSERDDYRTRAAALGADSVVHYLHAPEAVLLSRLADRNARQPQGTFQIPPQNCWSGCTCSKLRRKTNPRTSLLLNFAEMLTCRRMLNFHRAPPASPSSQRLRPSGLMPTPARWWTGDHLACRELHPQAG